MPPPETGRGPAERQAFHGAPCGLLSTDRDGVVSSANDTLLGWLGLSRGEVVGRRRFPDLLTPAGRIYAETHLLPMLRVRGGFQEVALLLRSPSGVERHVLASAQLTGAKGADGAAATMALFPAEQRRSYERELVAMRAAAQTRVNLLRQVESMAGVGAWVLDVAGRSVTWSDQIFRLHDLPVGPPPSLEAALSFYKPAFRDLVAGHIERAIAGGEPFQFEADLLTAKGREVRVRAQGEAEQEMGRVVRVVGVVQDITEQHAIAQRLWRSAHIDELSGLANRAWFRSRLAQEVEVRRPFALLLLDLDGFKAVNDSFGHPAGDAVICRVAERLRAVCTGGEFLARLGGDEFAILAEGGPAGASGAVALAEAIRTEIRRPIACEGDAAQVTASIGMAFLPRDAATADQLLRAADQALYDAKRRGRDRVSLAAERDGPWHGARERNPARPERPASGDPARPDALRA